MLLCLLGSESGLTVVRVLAHLNLCLRRKHQKPNQAIATYRSHAFPVRADHLCRELTMES